MGTKRVYILPISKAQQIYFQTTLTPDRDSNVFIGWLELRSRMEVYLAIALVAITFMLLWVTILYCNATAVIRKLTFGHKQGQTLSIESSSLDRTITGDEEASLGQQNPPADDGITSIPGALNFKSNIAKVHSEC